MIIVSFLIFPKIKSKIFFFRFLGDQEMTHGCHYWELRPLADWKSFSVGVAYRATLGRFDQLGKSTGSWCLHASQWLQTSLAAKHNNRVKTLDWPMPQRIGIYCDYDSGEKKSIMVTFLRLVIFSDSISCLFQVIYCLLMSTIFVFFTPSKQSSASRLSPPSP